GKLPILSVVGAVAAARQDVRFERIQRDVDSLRKRFNRQCRLTQLVEVVEEARFGVWPLLPPLYIERPQLAHRPIREQVAQHIRNRLLKRGKPYQFAVSV